MSFAKPTSPNLYSNANGKTPLMPSAAAISGQRTPTPHSTKQDSPPSLAGDKPSPDFPPPSTDADLLLPDIENSLNMSDQRPPLSSRSHQRTRSSLRRFHHPPSRPQIQPTLSAPGSSNPSTYPHASPTVENRPQYSPYPPPQPHYPPHTGYVTPYASQPMVTNPAYPYSVHSPIDVQGAIGLPVYMHPQQHDSSPPNLPSPSPSSFPQHGHMPAVFGHQPSPPPHVASGPSHFSNNPGYHAMPYSSQPHFGYSSNQSYPNPGYQHHYLSPSFHSPYQADHDSQWWYARRYEGPQYLPQQSYHPPYQPQQQQSPAEHYQQQQPQSGPSSDVQLRSPRDSQPQAGFTPTRPRSEPTSPSPRSPLHKPDPPVQSPPPSNTSKGPVRQSYHPNPPPQRSEWVMWAGNVPSDATNDELWRFFSKPQDPSDGATEQNAGVSSIFLIARSNCAFVNFETEAHLNAAIPRFSGQKIRPDDPKCPSLVCRVRKKTDDLRAGVGGQRGVGLHMKWIQERKQKGKAAPKSPVDEVTRATSNLSFTSDEEGSGGGDGNRSFEQSSGSGSGSFASTTSSVLAQHFPKRYFILKSLTQFDLDLSVEKGYWATQRHNEIILDQAYRSSTDVYLIFGVNKSGEFYGYARMAGPILQSNTRVAWASRTNSPTSTRGERTNWALSPSLDTPSSRAILPLSEHRFADSSPSPFLTPSPVHGRNSQSQSRLPGSGGVAPSPSRSQGATDVDEAYFLGESDDLDGLETPNRETVSAPAELHQLHRKMTMDTPARFGSDMVPRDYEVRSRQLSSTKTRSMPVSKHVTSFEPSSSTRQAIAELRERESHDFHLDTTAPTRALRHPPASSSTGAGTLAGNLMGIIEEQRGQSGSPESMLDPAKTGIAPAVNETNALERAPSPGRAEGANDKRAEDPTWGEPFKLQWIKTERLPFYRTRHLRNPWNHDREIKVSRDGTELEPSVGQALLEEWDRVVEVPSTDRASQQHGQGSSRQGRGKGSAIGSQRGKR